uniref:Metalloendopeptidase OMA1, mitochondrial n=1 Tax=Timema californicum TaxID=61474 RepID=A0A7R9J5T0_TIMCA|nr:unnamed protein product [Timema californicum]
MFNLLLLKKCSNHCRYFELLIKKGFAHYKYTLQLDKKYVLDLTNNKCKLTSCNYNQSFMHSASSMLPLKSHPNNLSSLYLFSKFASHFQSQQSQELHTVGFSSPFKSPQKIESCNNLSNGIAHPLVTQPFRSLHTPVKESSVWVYFMILIRPLSKVVAIVFGRSFRKWWKSLPPNKRKLFMEALKKNKYKILFYTSVLTGLSYYFYYSHLEENPLTRKQRFILFTQDQIMQLAAIELEAQMMLFGDKILNPSHPVYKRVSRVAHAIIRASKDMKGIPNMKWSITVINDPAVRNAFVLPDGKMFIFTGMIAECSNDDQLAIIMTHEMAHALLSHMTLLEGCEPEPTEENIREWLNGEDGDPGYQIQTEEEIAPDVLSSTTTDQNTDNEEELQPLSKSKLSTNETYKPIPELLNKMVEMFTAISNHMDERKKDLPPANNYSKHLLVTHLIIVLAEQLSNVQLIEMFLLLALIVIWAVLPDGAAILSQFISHKFVTFAIHLPFSRKLELEADIVGLDLAARLANALVVLSSTAEDGEIEVRISVG